MKNGMNLSFALSFMYMPCSVNILYGPLWRCFVFVHTDICGFSEISKWMAGFTNCFANHSPYKKIFQICHTCKFCLTKVKQMLIATGVNNFSVFGIILSHIIEPFGGNYCLLDVFSNSAFRTYLFSKSSDLGWVTRTVIMLSSIHSFFFSVKNKIFSYLATFSSLAAQTLQISFNLFLFPFIHNWICSFYMSIDQYVKSTLLKLST